MWISQNIYFLHATTSLTIAMSNIDTFFYYSLKNNVFSELSFLASYPFLHPPYTSLLIHRPLDLGTIPGEEDKGQI